MTEYRHVRSIQQYGLLPGGGNTAGNKQRNMNHFLPIDGLLVSYEHIRPTANVALVLSKTTLEKHPELMEDFSLSKNGYFLTKAVIPAGLFSLAWDIRNNCCLSTKLWDVPDSTPAMSVQTAAAGLFDRQRLHTMAAAGPFAQPVRQGLPWSYN